MVALERLSAHPPAQARGPTPSKLPSAHIARRHTPTHERSIIGLPSHPNRTHTHEPDWTGEPPLPHTRMRGMTRLPHAQGRWPPPLPIRRMWFGPACNWTRLIPRASRCAPPNTRARARSETRTPSPLGHLPPPLTCTAPDVLRPRPNWKGSKSTARPPRAASK